MTGNGKIFLESERLWFRQHVPDDRAAYIAMEQDPEVRRYVGGYPRTREAAEQKFTGALEPSNTRLSMWATILKEEHKYIGRCGIYPHFDQNGVPVPGEASLGLYIAKDYWGRGLATEAGRAFINFGFDVLKLNRIATMVQVGNDASVRVLEKLGFDLVATEKGEHRSFYHFVLVNTGMR